jgi:Zn finger protein HypA/HybF involved in hydrogenase expression
MTEEVRVVHEVSLVAALVEACQERAGEGRVRRLSIRHASTIEEDVIRQAFTMLTEGGPLEDAVLETERFEVRLECGCGFAGVLGHDDEAGPHVVCPACGALHAAPRTAEIELLAIDLETPPPARP